MKNKIIDITGYFLISAGILISLFVFQEVFIENYYYRNEFINDNQLIYYFLSLTWARILFKKIKNENKN